MDYRYPELCAPTPDVINSECLFYICFWCSLMIYVNKALVRINMPNSQYRTCPNLITDHFTPEFIDAYGTNGVKPEYHELGTVLSDGGDVFGVSSVMFDKTEELLWMGNQGVSLAKPNNIPFIKIYLSYKNI